MSVIYITHKGIVFASTYTRKCVIVQHQCIEVSRLSSLEAKQTTIGHLTEEMHLGSLKYIRGAGFSWCGRIAILYLFVRSMDPKTL